MLRTIQKLCEETRKELLCMIEIGIAVSDDAITASGDHKIMNEYINNPISIGEIADILTRYTHRHRRKLNMRHFAISTENTALLPITVDDGFYPVGINGNIALFEKDDKGQRHVELPVSERARCTLSEMRIEGEDQYHQVPVIELNPTGEYITDLSIEGGANTWWLIIRAIVPEQN